MPAFRERNKKSFSIEKREERKGEKRGVLRRGVTDFIILSEWKAFISKHADRFMVGCDELVNSAGKRSRHGSPSFTQTWCIIEQMPPDVAKKVGHDTAAKVYNLNGCAIGKIPVCNQYPVYTLSEAEYDKEDESIGMHE